MLEQHLEKLQSFYIVAQEKSLLKAALRLSVTQPAVTKSIRAVEAQLGTSLLVRHNRGVELTEAGVKLYRFCDCLFLKTQSVEQEIKNTRGLSGTIRIGTYETLGELFWPKVLKQINQKYPMLTIELTTQDPSSIWVRLTHGGIDLVVDAEPRISETLFSKILYTDRFGLFCKTGSKFLVANDPVPASYALKASDHNGVTIEEHLRKMSIPLELRYSVESFTLTRSFILEDVCVGVLPLMMAHRYLVAGRIQQYPSTQKSNHYFGEHRVCATVLENLKSEEKITAILAILKSQASLYTVKINS
jgi:DNA-binding transcriptional LysR family regulator